MRLVALQVLMRMGFGDAVGATECKGEGSWVRKTGFGVGVMDGECVEEERTSLARVIAMRSETRGKRDILRVFVVEAFLLKETEKRETENESETETDQRDRRNGNIKTMKLKLNLKVKLIREIGEMKLIKGDEKLVKRVKLIRRKRGIIVWTFWKRLP